MSVTKRDLARDKEREREKSEKEKERKGRKRGREREWEKVKEKEIKIKKELFFFNPFKPQKIVVSSYSNEWNSSLEKYKKPWYWWIYSIV